MDAEDPNVIIVNGQCLGNTVVRRYDRGKKRENSEIRS